VRKGLISAAAVLAVLVVPGSAMASTVTANTHANNHPDTTSVYTGVNSDNGPVWAYDNLELKFTSVALGGDEYQVTIDATGSFHGFANPITGAPDVNDGSVKGTITYLVDSTTAPQARNLPAQEPSTAGQSSTMVPQFYGSGFVGINGGGAYTYTYSRVDGSVYQQTG
jgi:hypothetical protein